MLLRNPCHFFFVTLFDYLNVFTYVGQANKIKIKIEKVWRLGFPLRLDVPDHQNAVALAADS